jgi:hypothetical protein
MKILTDNKYIGTLERKLAIVVNSNMVMTEEGNYIPMKRTMDDFVQELARACRSFQNTSIDENFS